MSDRVKIALLLTPALAIIVILFFGGLAVGLMRSFSYMPVIGLTEPNLRAYAAVFTDREFYLSFLLTFHIAFTSTVISAALAIGAALLLRRQFIGRAVVNFSLSTQPDSSPPRRRHRNSVSLLAGRGALRGWRPNGA